MLTKKKKLSRKDIKEDKLVTSYYKAYDFFEEHRSKILLYGGALVIVILAVIFYVNNRQERNETAAYYLSNAMELYDNGSYLEAIEGQQGTDNIGLKKLVEEYGGTENGETAKIYLANSYNMLGNYDEAVKYFEDYGGSIDLYKATALAGQGGYYAYKNEYEKAADFYRQAASITEMNVQNPEYLLQSGIYYIKAGENQEAEEVLSTIKNKYEKTPTSREADKYLALVES